jgi:hypothetical protein
MGLIVSLTETLKAAITPKLDWKAGATGIGNTLKKDKPSAILVREDTTRDEFSERYRNLRITCASAFGFFVLCLLSVVLSKSLGDFGFRLLASAMLGLLYFRYAYMCWVCRQGWLNWEKRYEPVSTNSKDYLTAFVNDPTELFPIKLPRQGARP